MVHDRHSVDPDIPNKEMDSSNKTENHSIIHPQWTIDDDGIPYCTEQTEYEKIIKSNLKKRFPYEFEKRLNCQHCDHYYNDDCYFPKSELDKIEKDRLNQTIRCELCGAKIDRPFSILMSYDYKDQYGIKMPIICCSCYAGLENGTFMKNSKRRMILFLISLFTSLYFLFTFFITVFSFTWTGILIVLLPFSFWGYISFRDIKNIYYLHKGRKYFQKLMNAESSEDSSSSQKDQEDNPPEGAFYSPGYEY